MILCLFFSKHPIPSWPSYKEGLPSPLPTLVVRGKININFIHILSLMMGHHWGGIDIIIEVIYVKGL